VTRSAIAARAAAAHGPPHSSSTSRRRVLRAPSHPLIAGASHLPPASKTQAALRARAPAATRAAPLAAARPAPRRAARAAAAEDAAAAAAAPADLEAAAAAASPDAEEWAAAKLAALNMTEDTDLAEATRYELKFLWLEKNVGVAVDQVFASGNRAPVTEFYFWPRKDAWEELKAALEAAAWIGEREKVLLLNRCTEVINFWQDESKHSLAEARAKFPDCVVSGNA
jgi:30S ribosomal protein 3